MRDLETTILIVEDNAVLVRVAKLRLQRYGLELVFANNGFEAVSLFKERRFDLILMDIMMPELNGLDATRIIRSLEQGGRRTPIVAITATEDPENCFAAGMDDFVSKPADYDRVIKRWLPGLIQQGA